MASRFPPSGRRASVSHSSTTASSPPEASRFPLPSNASVATPALCSCGSMPASVRHPESPSICHRPICLSRPSRRKERPAGFEPSSSPHLGGLDSDRFVDSGAARLRHRSCESSRQPSAQRNRPSAEKSSAPIDCCLLFVSPFADRSAFRNHATVPSEYPQRRYRHRHFAPLRSLHHGRVQKCAAARAKEVPTSRRFHPNFRRQQPVIDTDADRVIARLCTKREDLAQAAQSAMYARCRRNHLSRQAVRCAILQAR